MNKYGILTGCFLTGISLSTVGVAQDASAPEVGTADVAQLLYQVNKTLIKQQGIIDTTHQAVIDAHEFYVENPNDSTYKALLNAVTKDTQAIQTYSKLVNEAKRVEAQIEQAEKTFYGETPATKADIETGPVGQGTPPGGESVASEIPEPPSVIIADLKKEIKENGGLQGNFADQLATQANKLKSLQDRIAKEQTSPAVRSNPTANKQDVDLRSVLEKAIMARRNALKGK